MKEFYDFEISQKTTYKLDLKHTSVSNKIAAFKYSLTRDDIINAQMILNLYNLVKIYNTLDDEFFASSNIYINSIEELLITFNIIYYFLIQNNRINYMKAKEVLKILGITQQTLWNWTKSGKIKINAKLSRTYNDYNEDSVYALIGRKSSSKNKLIVSYARVSTQNQKNQLNDQNQRIYDSCISRGLKLEKQFSDIKSGMSSDRKDFQELIRMIIQGKVELLVIENKDRLIRFGYEILEQIFKYFGCKILVLNDILENKTYQQELTDDLISIIHYFSMKNYSHRRKLNKLRKELENNEKNNI